MRVHFCRPPAQLRGNVRDYGAPLQRAATNRAGRAQNGELLHEHPELRQNKKQNAASRSARIYERRFCRSRNQNCISSASLSAAPLQFS